MTDGASVGTSANARRPRLTIRASIILLIGATLLPTLALAVLSGLNYAQSQQRVIETERHAIARRIVDLFDADLNIVEVSLRALARAPALADNDLDTFRRYAVETARVSGATSVALFDRDGTALFSSATEPGAPAPAAIDKALFADAFQNKAVVSGLGGPAQDQAIVIAVPANVDRNGAVDRVLTASVPVEQFAGIFKEAGLPAEWIASIIDARGLYVARSRLNDETIATPIRRRFENDKEDGYFEGVSIERIPIGTFFRKSPSTGFVALVAIPLDILNAPLRDALLQLVVIGASLLSLGVALSFLLANRISEPVQDSARAALALVQGMPHQFRDYPIAEIHDIGRAFDRAAVIMGEGEATNAALRKSEERLRIATKSGGVAIFELDLEQGSFEASPLFHELYGFPADQRITYRDFLARLHSDDRQRITAQNKSLFSSGRPFRSEFRIVPPDGGVRWMMVSGEIFADAQGRPLRLIGANLDITEDKRIAANDAELAAVMAASDDAIFTIDRAGLIKSWNAGAEAMLGYTLEEVYGRPIWTLFNDSESKEFDERQPRLLQGEMINADAVRRRKDGSLLDVSAHLSPIRSANREIIGVSVSYRDITRRKRSEEHLRFLLRELAHRGKNQLAIIQSMAAQTSRGATSIADFQEKFVGRLHGLSASVDLLLNRAWGSIELIALARSQLNAFSDDGPERLMLGGPLVELGSEAAQSLGLALHELATNAVKYGAWSAQDGRVALTWTREAEKVRLTWRESGGPHVDAPKRKGFGTLVIDKMASVSLTAAVRLDFAETGVVWEIAIPVDRLNPPPADPLAPDKKAIRIEEIA